MRLACSVLIPLLLAACGDRAEDAPGAGATPPPAPPPVTSPADTLNAELLAKGRQVYEAVCAECHAIDPPVITAPTLREIAVAYRASFPDAAEGLEHLAGYVRAPDSAESLLPKVMIDEWGVMPAQPLPEEDLAAVAYFVWHLQLPADSAAQDTTVVDTTVPDTTSPANRPRR